MNSFLKNKWLVSLLAGLFLGLAFPPIDLSYLSIPAFVLLIYLANLSSSYRELMLVSYPGFVLWNLITTYWLMMASVGAGLAAILANALLMTLPLCLIRFFQRKFSSVLVVALLQTAAWITYEYFHHNWDLAWPWLTIGNAWANHVSLIQYIAITGHLGISFWVILTAALAYQVVVKPNQRLAFYTILVFLVPPAGSLIYFGVTSPIQSTNETVSVTVIQPNHDSYLRYGGMSGNPEVLDSLFSITQKTRAANSDLVVWPENAIEDAVLMNSYEVRRIADSARAWNTNFIVGTGLITLYNEHNTPDLVRGYYRGQIPYNVYNGALYVNRQGETSRYDKRHLVPLVERFPFVDFFASIDVFNWVDWGHEAGFGKGDTPSMLQTRDILTPGLICYDSVYPTWIREFVDQGAGFITIITNDGWWGNSSGHLQHFAYARLRAIEFNRWVVRSANNGTSGIIRPDGTIEQKTDYWVRTGFNSTIPIIRKQTWYATFGDWLAYQCIGLVIIFWIIGKIYPQSVSTLIE